MYLTEPEPPMGETLHSRTALRSTLVSRCISGAGVCLSAVLTGALILRARHSGLRQRIVMARIILLIQSNLLQDSVMPFCEMFRLLIIPLTRTRTRTPSSTWGEMSEQLICLPIEDKADLLRVWFMAQ